MKRREMLYSDYGMPPELVKELKTLCKHLDEEGHINLLLCAMKANRGIAPAIYYSLASGASYDFLSDKMIIPVSKVDFYAYQRYCLFLFNNTRKEQQARIVYGLI